MIKTLTEGFTLGLVTGTSCLATCTPIYLPYLLSEDNSILKSLLKVTEISAGRFLSYLAFGALAGYSGSKIGNTNRLVFTSIAYILLSIFLLLNTFRVVKNKKCSIPFYAKITESAFLLGILTGINFCPSFLIALSKAIELNGAVSGIFLFTGFFAGTTIFLIPIAFAGGLTHMKKIKLVAKYFSVLIAIWFLFQGITGLFNFSETHKHHAELNNKRMVDTFAPKQNITIISTYDNIKYFLSVKDSLSNHSSGKVTISTKTEKINENDIVFFDTAINDSILLAKISNYDRVKVPKNYNITKMINFLKSHVFRTNKNLDWEFSNAK